MPWEKQPGEICEIVILYETSPTGGAFSWLTAEQTICGKLPYVLTDCEDINARTVYPLQDTPSNRITYAANITAPKEFTVKMSANETGIVPSQLYEGFTTTSFRNDIPIPSYLIVLAIGDLQYLQLGERVGVITEPCFMEKVATELQDISNTFGGVESYMGPYIWGNYTILVLPSSYPWGGMENPLLTFASPTIIVGDKSQVDVVTHEMAHSWTGN